MARSVGEDGGHWRGVTVVKVKAHTDEGAVREGIITERDRYGNMQADAEAKRGARLAETLSPIGAARSELIKGMRWMGWVRRFAAVWRADHEEEAEEGVRGARAADEGRPRGRVAAGLRHLVWERGLEWKCRRCGRLAATSLKRKDLQSSRCLGSAMGRLLQRTCQDAGAVERCCLERREDMLSRGWRPRGGVEGGEAEPGGTSRPFGEEEEWADHDRGSEEEEERRRWGKGKRRMGGVDSGFGGHGQGSAGGGGCGSNSAAAALAGGSGSATAAAAPTGLAAEATPLLGDLPGPPAEKARNVRPRLSTGEARSAEPAHGQTVADEDLERGRGIGDARLLVQEEQFDEDPFGHVAADLALQPALRQHEAGGAARLQDDDAARPRPHVPEGQAARVAPGGRGRHHDDCEAERRVLAAPGEHPSRGVQGDETWPREEGDTAQRRQHAPGGQAVLEAQGSGGSSRGTRRTAAAEPIGVRKRRRTDAGEGPPQRPATPPEEARGDKRASSQLQPGPEPKRGRRYASLVADPVDGADAGGHLLRVSGPLIWCSRCGRYAMRRVRGTLRGACGGEATGAYATRVARMWAGKHPLTGEPLT